MTHDVIIVGGGPAGLTAARHLLNAGVRDVVIIERNPETGGLPRFCLHPGWGMFDFRRVMRGPDYARALTQAAAGATIMTDCTVTALQPGGVVQVNTPTGPATLAARFVLLATGIRETPRSARLVSGLRPWGVTTTGAFQEMARFRVLPFRAPLIVGSELVAFSALETARHAGVRPVAMLEEQPRLSVPRALALAARARYRTPIHTSAHIVDILGRTTLEGAIVRIGNREQHLACDSIVFSGRFVPEATLVDGAMLERDATGTRGPAIDQFFRCTDPHVFAAGNVLRGVEHSGYVAHEGREAAHAILRAMRGDLPAAETAVRVQARDLRYVYPQRLVPAAAPARLFARANGPHDGALIARDGEGHVIARKTLRRLSWPRLTLDVSVPVGKSDRTIVVARESARP